MSKDIIFPENVMDSLFMDSQNSQNLAFMPLLFVQATFPYSSSKEHEFRRKNGKFELVLYSPSGLPYGSIPRIVIAYLVTEAVRQKSRTIYLGANLSDFLRKLGLGCTGGKNGTIQALRNQLDALFNCYVSYSAIDQSDHGKIKKTANMVIADESALWWEPHSLYDESGKFMSYVVLSERFYEAAISSPIPVDLDIIMKLKRSPMAVDIYCWATYRASYLKSCSRISWDDLALQFGSGCQSKRLFKFYFRKYIKQVAKYYPGLRFDDSNSKYFVLYPSKPSISIRDGYSFYIDSQKGK